MTRKKKILVCIFSNLSQEVLRRYVSNAVTFAQRIEAEVHFLVPKGYEGRLNLEVKSSFMVTSHAVKIVSHRVSGDFTSPFVIESVKDYSCELMVLPSGDENLKKDLVEQSITPILILTPNVDLVARPIESILVPMSGEIRVSSALKFGLRLASTIHVPVDLVHVALREIQDASSLDTLGDRPCHEYRHLLDRVLAEATPFSNTKERAQVRNLYHVEGKTSVEILRATLRSPSCAIVAQWHGLLNQGRAETLKEIIHRGRVPLFLVRAEAEQGSVLKIGPETRAA